MRAMSSLGIMQETLDVKVEDDKNETFRRLEEENLL